MPVASPPWHRPSRPLQFFPLSTFRVLQNSWKWKTKPKQFLTIPTNSSIAVTKKKLSQFGFSQEAGGQLPCNAWVTPLSQTYWGWPLCPSNKTHLQYFLRKTRLGFQRSKWPTEGENTRKPSISPRGESKRAPPTRYKTSKQCKSKPDYNGSQLS